MALSITGTPKTNILTSRKMIMARTSGENFMPPSTPRTPLATPRRTAKTPVSTRTPECFNKVVLETPNSNVKSSSNRDKSDEISNLTVAVRIRPMNSRELATVGSADVVRVRNQDIIIRSNASSNSAMSVDHIFQYDHIFWSCDEKNPLHSTQEEVFLTVGKPLLNSAFKGYNACLFAYGQTGSGKSYSMMGPNSCEASDIDSEEYAGITPRFCKDLFERVSQLPPGATAAIEVSYFEIYNEKIHDLLASGNTTNKTPLKVREHPVWGPYVVDLSMHPVKSYKELRNWLITGNKNRATAATNMNEKSSRSHSIFSIEICLSEGLEGEKSRRSKVSLIDLAGSERLVTSHNTEEKIKQGVSINKSLLTLGKVISSLADQKRNQFVPYRESVLTWLLKESLGGNSLTSMLATISPASTHIDETLATLRYACQARSIVNRARVNENPHDRLIRELRTEVERLKALRQDYERNSMSHSSINISGSSNTDELDELRKKLQDTENKLTEAEKNWQLRFMETKKMQLKDLAEAERLREELKSRVRIMKTAEQEVNLSPYRTNFLEELENVLEVETGGKSTNGMLDDIKNWCRQNNYSAVETDNSLIITDNLNKKQAVLMFSDVGKCEQYENIVDFVKTLQWASCTKDPIKKLSKNEVTATMNQIYQALSVLQPTSSDDNYLNLLYAKVNRALQTFETAVMNSVSYVNGQKTVTFDISDDCD